MPQEFFESLVTQLRSNRALQTPGNTGLLVQTDTHAFSLVPESWKEAVTDTRVGPMEWLNTQLQSKQPLLIADMNWGTGSKPTYLALGLVNGVVRIGWSQGGHFSADQRAEAYMRSKWSIWRPSGSSVH